MRDCFLGEEVWETLGMPPEVAHYVETSDLMRQFRNHLTRIVPILRDIGLWGPKVTTAFSDIGVIHFADADLDAEMAHDETIAEQLEAERDVQMGHVRSVASTVWAAMALRTERRHRRSSPASSERRTVARCRVRT